MIFLFAFFSVIVFSIQVQPGDFNHLCRCLKYENTFYSRDIGRLNEVSVWRCLSEYLQWLNVLAPFSWAIQCGFNLKLIIINMIYGFALVSKTWSHVSIWISHYNRLYLSRKNDWFGTIFAPTPISWMKEGKMWNWVQNQLLWKCRCSYFNRLVAC